MYAKELFISGTADDFMLAAPWFEQRLAMQGVSLDARAIIVTCISCYGAAVISTLVSTNIVMKSSPKDLLIKE